jgi:hypothetical protein
MRRAPWALVLAGWLIGLLALACYAPNIPDGSFTCDVTNNFSCPQELHCQNGVCVHARAVDASADAALTPDVAGCSDATREGLTDLTAFPNLAACDGAFSQQGIVNEDPPACNRQAGNNGAKSDGSGCNAADLCAAGWHVCRDLSDVASHDGTAGCTSLAGAAAVFYATRQRGAVLTGSCTGATSSDANDVHGCGSIGGVVSGADGCAPLDRRLRVAVGDCPAPWNCGNDDRVEGQNLTKTGLLGGGVLCCRDP